MSAARRVRGNLLTKHKAAGTYVPVRRVAFEVADVIIEQARIPKGRKTLFFESSGSVEARTTTREKSADTRHTAPTTKATEPRIVRGVASISEAKASQP